MEEVVLVNEYDEPRGTMEKMEAHVKGELHRAFSVFLFNSNNELLLHQRAFDKYHSGGLWTNTCCSHPRLNETVIKAGNRRLMEEMGMVANIEFGFTFIYNAKLDNALIEHELDHVLLGHSDAIPEANTNEVASYRYMSLDDILTDIERNPDQYTAWFKVCLLDHADKFRTFLA